MLTAIRGIAGTPTSIPASPSPSTVPDEVESLFREARDRTVRGDLDGAAQCYRRAMAALEAVSPDHPALAEPLNELAIWESSRGDHAAADALLARAQRLLEGQGAPRELALARVLASRAQVAELLSRDADARAFNERALALLRAHDDEGAPVWTASSGVLNALGGLAYRRRRWREAEPLFQQALAQLERALGPDDPRLLPLLENLQALYLSQGRADAAGPYARRAQRLRDLRHPAARRL